MYAEKAVYCVCVCVCVCVSDCIYVRETLMILFFFYDIVWDQHHFVYAVSNSLYGKPRERLKCTQIYERIHVYICRERESFHHTYPFECVIWRTLFANRFLFLIFLTDRILIFYKSSHSLYKFSHSLCQNSNHSVCGMEETL